jgi:hypothetical protein
VFKWVNLCCYTVVVGGGYNQAQKTYSVIVGGYNNTVKAVDAVIAGGTSNTVGLYTLSCTS